MKLGAAWRKRIKRWREGAIVNVYRGLLLLVAGASPVILRSAILTPIRAAVTVGAVLALARNTSTLRLLWAKAPVPDFARDALWADFSRFSSLTSKGPIWRAGVKLVKRLVDCQREPQPPSAIHVTQVRSTSAKVSWDPTVVSFLSDENYRVEVAPTRADAVDAAEVAGEWTQLADTADTSCECSELRPDTVYRCRVVAHNNKGTSQPRSARFVTLQPPTAANGGRAPAYGWSQDVKEVAVRVPVPTGTRAADLAITCTKSRLRVALKPRGGAGAEAAERVLCAGTLHREVDPDEFAWQFVEPAESEPAEAGGRVIELTLPKADPSIGKPLWPAVVTSVTDTDLPASKSVIALHVEHPRIDLSLIKQEVPELSDAHLHELHELMRGAPIGGEEDD